MAPPSSSTLRLLPRRPLRPRRPLFPSIRPRRRHSKPLLPLHLSLSPPHNTSPPPSLHLSLAPPSPSPITHGAFWWLHAPHAEPPSALVHALWAELCKRPILTEFQWPAGGGNDQVLSWRNPRGNDASEPLDGWRLETCVDRMAQMDLIKTNGSDVETCGSEQVDSYDNMDG